MPLPCVARHLLYISLCWNDICFACLYSFCIFFDETTRAQYSTNTNAQGGCIPWAFAATTFPDQKGVRRMDQRHPQSSRNQKQWQVYSLFFSMRSLHTGDLFKFFANNDTPKDAMEGLFDVLEDTCKQAVLPCEKAACAVVLEQATDQIKKRGWT